MKGQRGQSLMEVIFAVGLIVSVVTGVVVLMVNSVAARTKAFDRKKAVELGQLKLESVIVEAETDNISFWDLNSSYWVTNKGKVQTDGSYKGYDYIVDIAQYSGNGCSASSFECATVTVSVGWSGSSDRNVFSRFFSRR